MHHAFHSGHHLLHLVLHLLHFIHLLVHGLVRLVMCHRSLLGRGQRHHSERQKDCQVEHNLISHVIHQYWDEVDII